MEGYWKDPKRTNEAMERHPDEPDIVWMRTGDIGIMDEEGYVRIVGRSKDVIIRGGEFRLFRKITPSSTVSTDMCCFHPTMKARTSSHPTSKSKFDLVQVCIRDSTDDMISMHGALTLPHFISILVPPTAASIAWKESLLTLSSPSLTTNTGR